MQARAMLRPGIGQDGIVDLPSGKIAAIATYLEMTRPGAQAAAAAAEDAAELNLAELGASFQPIAGDIARYRVLYRNVGEPWLWFSRARIPDAALARILNDPLVEALAFNRNGQDIGIVELDFRHPGQCELSFLGLVPDAIGRGYGRVMIGEAIRRAFARPATERLWLHTCTLDHPGALPFYMAAGFRPFRRAIEIAQDPRLTGEMARDAAPHLPIV
jgi:GNAT superfamily N-acetyltransferase